ncbi:aldose 1-epimerase [Lihuaxuella thermophila]|uniref:Aldose 1-epimerase n=2 Tax=Lihuaxuella thermophila TaxID=1173111 RepID=A0A1H8FTR6_9BACL|nr:aldose 1-epimerase [Lihuaxuella thermophila]
MGMSRNSHQGIGKTTFNGEKAIQMTFYPYSAVILPEIGGNLVSFADIERDYRFIREPALEEMSSFKKQAILHGIPVLFPPNRYENGRFRLSGRSYQWPVNEEVNQNHIHGFLYDQPWQIYSMGESEEAVYAELIIVNEPGGKIFSYFPHFFEIRLRYELSGVGLTKRITVTNTGKDPMLCMLGFHTAINAPFAPESTMEDCLLKLTIGKRIELSDRMLPTGRFLPLTPEEVKMKREGISPFFAPLDNHYTAEAQDGHNRMVLTDLKEKVRLVYDVGTKFKFWMIYNHDAKSGFICPEPQTNMVNAPNLNLPPEQTGMVILDGGESWSETSRIFPEKF